MAGHVIYFVKSPIVEESVNLHLMKTPNFTIGGFMRPSDVMWLRFGELAVSERSFAPPDEFDCVAS